ncbi:hypothetical protein EI94DRAFT_1757048 [Lactarius quietus]|nr:hypothetical protein EI94DRAFT_1757048 [Lactarius quietus]
MPLASSEYQRQAIDAEIKSLEESIRVLRRRRNALAPISSLPPEVIAAIFSFSRATLSDFIPGEKPDPLAWLRVSHVCHQWRETALNQPLFWNHVDFTTLSSAGAAEILARAKTVPLYLKARVSGGHWDKSRLNGFQEELQRRIPRICHLLISANIRHLRDTLSSLVSPAPTLERLSLSSKEHRVQVAIPETLFGGTTPKLSYLELRNCDISWESSLLKGLKDLKIRGPSPNVRPSLSAWLDALDEMPQLEVLTLHEASPMTFSFQFDVERTVTLPSLTHLDISDSTSGCALALAHLELPTLTCLCLKASSRFADGDDVREVLPYVLRHAHGSQDTQPLQSVLIHSNYAYAGILAWPVSNIDAEVHKLPTLLAAAPPARVALSFTSEDWHPFHTHLEVFGTVLAALPLDNLETLIAQDLISPLSEDFWLLNSPKWPLLRRLRLQGGRENPLLPSLKELALVDSRLHENWTLCLCDVLMKRVEQGVPLEMLDLPIRLLGEIVDDVLGPEGEFEARARVRSSTIQLDTDDDDDDDHYSDTSGNEDGEEDEENHL